MGASRKSSAGDTVTLPQRVKATVCSKCKTVMVLLVEERGFALLECSFCKREIGIDLDPVTGATFVRFRGHPWLWPPEAFDNSRD
jgi:hypothetical protein